MSEYKKTLINKIETALEDLRNGKMIIVSDNEDRENEGDIVLAAEKVTHENINFILKEARGLICVPMTEERALKLGLDIMVKNNTDEHGTNFTISVDSKRTTTGISVEERKRTIKDLSKEELTKEDFKKPGHIFPLIAKKNGLLERKGHTEAAVDLLKLSGLTPVGVICEILKADGTMARREDLIKFSKKHNLTYITIEEILEYIKLKNDLVEEVVSTKLPTKYGDFNITAFSNKIDEKEHIIIHKGEIYNQENILMRIHSECFTGDILGSLKCDCGSQLEKAMKKINEEGRGIIFYLRQEGRNIGLYNKLKAYKLQEEGYDTVEANRKLGFLSDERDYFYVIQVLKKLNISSVKLMTNNPSKINFLERYGIKVTRKNIEIECNEINYSYLKVKKEKMNHILEKI
ncbi:3,4-dihydroxy 2-butanone 4-phosphate synthase/GTP cyclohydrolase II [Hypnocyclicus thermotrophus]|uniref:Riboflavin biosynthesis protein RibBA n=1 Tax=Hypnocyclicus thermotrophus TaxID=1627895 RepID=A0AA46E012_9FUSO|nr:3,4-dihydroxy-2-butanone-4-phosphate synthase [Hypnocyclicus thermotrophus]TDT72035.1 3,4-dihydroxy 2-butanone 4-phosphate synthase/GTP cyclohydrolase II [Hypnocyclicus thermotrophus]